MRLAARVAFAGIAAGLALTAGSARAGSVEGTVFFDRDGNGLLSAGDTPVAGALVGWGHVAATRTDAQGRYRFERADGDRAVVWVSVPEGGVPGPVWGHGEATPQGATVDLAIRPLGAEAAAPLTFVVLSDSHMDGHERAWLPADLARALDQALVIDPPPRFFTIVGDITQANRPADFDATAEALAGVAVPWVPVPGNHDWYDGGAAYRERWGPDSYSFTTGGVRFLVWNTALDAGSVIAFVRRDLADVDPATPVIALGHVPPRDDLARAMRDAGVDALFTGHWHANRVVDHGGMREYGTQAAIFGGIDLAPAGYRVVRVDGGALDIVHHTFVDERVVRLVWPSADRCVPPDVDLLAAVEIGPGIDGVTAEVAGRAIELEPVGGWTWRAPAAGLPPGVHGVRLVARGAGDDVVGEAAFTVCAPGVPEPRPPRAGTWPQHQGDPEHRAASADGPRPALATAWATPVGGHLHVGAPVVDDGLVFVAVSDLAGGGGGGLAALDLATGAPRWWFPTAFPARHAPAVAAGVVVVATTEGTVWGVDQHTGMPRWHHALGAGVDAIWSALWAPPAVRDDTVYIAVQHQLAAIDAATGQLVWSVPATPLRDTSSSCSALAVTEDLVLGVTHRNSGIAAWRRDDGAEVWRVVDPVIGVHGAVTVGDGLVYVVSVRGEVIALDLATGAERWRRFATSGHDWSYAGGGSPALADGLLYVPTTWERFVALDAATGAERWAIAGRRGPLRTAHYRGATPGFLASPLVAAGIVWIPDTSGRLLALDAATGRVQWSTDLGTPALGGLALAGEVLLVTTWDGVVRALAPAALLPPVDPPDPIEVTDGCCRAGGGGGAPALLALVTLAALGRRVARASRPPPA